MEAASEGRRRRSFTREYKAEVVQLCRASGQSIARVARDLDLTETAMRRWVAQAEVDAGQREGLTTADGSSELAVPVYELCSQRELLGAMAMERMLAGLSTRR